MENEGSVKEMKKEESFKEEREVITVKCFSLSVNKN